MVPISRTSDALVAPVTTTELAGWGRFEATDPILQPLLDSSTAIVLENIKRDLITRNWNLTYWDWPTEDNQPKVQLNQKFNALATEIRLPYTAINTTVTQVLIDGELADAADYTLREDALYFEYIAITNDETVKALEVEYTAGYGATAADVPKAIKDAIKTLATHFYYHRGCDAMSALQNSGAAFMLEPYRKAESLV